MLVLRLNQAIIKGHILSLKKDWVHECTTIHVTIKSDMGYTQLSIWGNKKMEPKKSMT